MSIRVTKSGKDDRLMLGVCEQCGCEIECLTRDTRVGARGQESVPVRFIECPSCAAIIYVKEKE